MNPMWKLILGTEQRPYATTSQAVTHKLGLVEPIPARCALALLALTSPSPLSPLVAPPSFIGFFFVFSDLRLCSPGRLLVPASERRDLRAGALQDWAELPAACRERVKERERAQGGQKENFLSSFLA